MYILHNNSTFTKNNASTNHNYWPYCADFAYFLFHEVINHQRFKWYKINNKTKQSPGRQCGVKVTEEFDPESENPEDMQRMGWQMILDRFKNYVESKN